MGIKIELVKQPNWQEWYDYSKRVIGLLNIARIAILFSLLIFSTMLVHMKSVHYVPLLRNQYWLSVWCIAYGFVIMVSIAYPGWQHQGTNLPNASSVVDITMMALLSFLAGGVSSGFGILMLPFLAAACLLSYGRYPFLYGTYAALLVACNTAFSLWPMSADIIRNNLPVVAGQILLIAACYAVPYMTSFSASYLSNAGDSVLQHRRAYERLRALNQIVFNRVQEAALVLDADSKLWSCNRQALKYFPNLVVGGTVPFAGELVHQWIGSGKAGFEVTAALEGLLMHVRAVPIVQKNTELLILFIRSDRDRQAEAQNVKLTSLGMLTANLAHEIRNPLSAIRQANGLLTESAEGDPLSEKLTGIIENNTARIDKMIEEVSSLNKRDRIRTESIRLIPFVGQFVQEFLLARPEVLNGCLTTDMPPEKVEVAFDAMHLQQILWNLCNNAWRHSSKGKESVVISVGYQDERHISLRVWDDGPGVAVEMLPHLFEPFQTNQAQGTGLGLYVARELAHANKGDLSYLPRAKSFELILPRVKI